MISANQVYIFKLRRQFLCNSLSGNRLDLLTITKFDDATTFDISQRKYIFLSARVHPGETNSSHIMHAVMQFLLSDDPVASTLRKAYIFKIIPMLNPDGVINGSHRCSLAGLDLNRCWLHPDEFITPEIYWSKNVIRYLYEQGRKPLISCDFHGHSREKGVFLFGCENKGPAVNMEKVCFNLLTILPRHP